MTVTKEDQLLDNRIEYLKSLTPRLQAAKEALEIDGKCPEVELTHETDPYNVGFIWASLSNALHSATDALNGILVYIEPGGLKDALEESQIVSEINSQKEICENDGTEKQHNAILDDDGK